MISVSTIWFSGMPDPVVWSEITLDVALWVKFKMAAFCQRSNVTSHIAIKRENYIFSAVVITRTEIEK